MADQLRKIRQWNVPTPLQGNIFFFGRVGSGKTSKMLTTAQNYYEKGYKIFDLFGGKREEGPFWAIPNDDHKLWRQLEAETYDFKTPGPKQYNVNILYPMFSTKLPKKLPQKSPHIKSKAFTIPLKEIEERDINLVLGGMGSNAQTLWKAVQYEAKDKSNGEDVKRIVNKKFPKMKKTPIWTLFLEPLIRNHTIASKISDTNLDLIDEAKDRGTVTVLCLDYVPEEFKFLIMGWIVKTLVKLAMANKIPKRNLALFREASAFMKVQDTDKSKEATTQVFRNQIVESARYARSGLYLAMDNQDSSEVKGMIEGSEDLLGICEMPSPTSREVTCKPLESDRRMNKYQIAYIATMPIHQICFVERGKKAVILKRIQPPRCKYFKSDEGNFYSQWKQRVDEWTYSEHFTSIIKEEYNARDEYFRSLDKANKAMEAPAEIEEVEPPKKEQKKKTENDESVEEVPQIKEKKEIKPKEEDEEYDELAEAFAT